MIPDVVEAKPLGGHRLSVRFDNGRSGEIDLSKRLTFTGVFKPLRDPSAFAQVRVNPDIGTICWPNDADVDPVVLYSWVTGESIESVLSKRNTRKHAPKSGKPVRHAVSRKPGSRRSLSPAR